MMLSESGLFMASVPAPLPSIPPPPPLRVPTPSPAAGRGKLLTALVLALAAPMLRTPPIPVAVLPRDSSTLEMAASFTAAVSIGADLEGAESMTVVPEKVPLGTLMRNELNNVDK